MNQKFEFLCQNRDVEQKKKIKERVEEVCNQNDTLRDLNHFVFEVTPYLVVQSGHNGVMVDRQPIAYGKSAI